MGPPLTPVVSAETQAATLERILTLTAALAEERRKPVVFVDLDLTALLPTVRMWRVLEAASTEFGVRDFADPSQITGKDGQRLIPGYTEEAWMCFVALTDLRKKYPQIDWDAPEPGVQGGRPGGALYAFIRRNYWEQDLRTDEVSPGLPEFRRLLAERGGEIFFVSGRPGTPEISLETLASGGVPNPVLLFGQRKTGLPVPREHVRDRDADTKYFWTVDTESAGHTVVAVIDDRFSNRTAVQAASSMPGTLSVAVAASRYSYSPDAADQSLPDRISDFRVFCDLER
jgi:hypothetical protein